MSKRSRIQVLPTPDPDKTCPCCVRGLVENGICQRCGVGIARGAEYFNAWTARGRVGALRQDQDRENPNIDYRRYKQDHAE